MENIKVSVICNTYNHEEYIGQALESIVNQKTNFPFEILVHDDASTDKTAEIIREYEKKYPDLIFPIYQTENQHSKKVKIGQTIQFPRARGKYTAFCEGDDYWTDNNKLQKQYDALEAHPEVDICAHGAIKIKDGRIAGYVKPKNEDCVIPFNDVILGGGGFVATNSLMWRSEVILKSTPMTDILYMDIVWQLQGSIRGGMLYLDDVMSAYRIAVKNSWTQRIVKSPEKFLVHTKIVNNMFRALDEYTEYKYSDAINKKILRNEFHILCVTHDYVAASDKKYSSVYSKLPLLRRLRFRCNFLKAKLGGKF